MEFNKLMNEVENMFNSWLNDDEINERFNGSVEDLQKEFLMCIQNKINSKFVMLSDTELQNKLTSYNNSMEGYYS